MVSFSKTEIDKGPDIEKRTLLPTQGIIPEIDER